MNEIINLTRHFGGDASQDLYYYIDRYRWAITVCILRMLDEKCLVYKLIEDGGVEVRSLYLAPDLMKVGLSNVPLIISSRLGYRYSVS